jgi:Kip1 ubiquitination-promoting complex protein 1
MIQLFTMQFESHSNFASFLATACVYKGKWMYEVVLDAEGIQQIGWANIDTPFTNMV